MQSPIENRASTGVDSGAAHTFETLGALVASLAARSDRIAVVAYTRSGAVSLSYTRLAELIRRTAHVLRRSGIGRGDHVALVGPNSPEWIVAYFGIVTAGAAAVPLDPQATAESTVAALLDAETKAVITTRAERATLAPLVGPGIRFWLLDGSDDEGALALAGNDNSSELPVIGHHDLASLLFTSGTTGAPKAVCMTHGNLAANLTALCAVNLIHAHDRVLLPLPLHHTYPFTVGLLTALATGATLVLPAGISGPEILEACRSSRPTALLAVPRLCAAVWDSVQSGVRARGALAARVFAALLAASIALRRHTKLRAGRWLFRSVRNRLGGALELIGCGGAKLPDELAWNLEGLGFRVLTGYGLTETSPVLTFNSPAHSRLGSEGRPLHGVEIRIADAGAAPGEILARGPSVFTGYWNNPAATAGTFTADGWFKTGDLGRIDADGYLHVVGRSKELVVLADGKKFFPEVVEKHYAGSLLLREVGVFERDGVLAAVVVPDDDELRRRGSLREAAAVREELENVASRLPPYQRITSYRVVRSPLPRTQLGKLRRHMLPALFDGAAQVRSNEAITLSAEDHALLATPLGANVWRWLRERFPATQLTLDTSPQLELNIDSLGWVALTVEIEQRFRVALRAERLARVLTLRDLLREVEAAQGDVGTPHSATAPFARPGPLLRGFGALLLAVARLLTRVVLRPVVSGLEHLPCGATLITPNHVSYLDPLAIAAALPWRRLRRTYWAGWAGLMHTSPLRRMVSRAVQVFPVDADRDLTAAMRTARELLAQGYDVVWFPEGRRSATGELQDFQSGIGVLAEGITAAIVPAAIDGTFAAWPRHRRWPRAARIRVAFGAPLDTASDAKPADVRARLQSAVQRLLADFGVAPPIDQLHSCPPRRP